MFDPFLQKVFVADMSGRVCIRTRIELLNEKKLETLRETERHLARLQNEFDVTSAQQVRMIVALDGFAKSETPAKKLCATYVEPYFASFRLGPRPAMAAILPAQTGKAILTDWAFDTTSLFALDQRIKACERGVPEEENPATSAFLETALAEAEKGKVDALLLFSQKACDEPSFALAEQFKKKGIKFFVVDCLDETRFDRKSAARETLARLARAAGGVHGSLEKGDLWKLKEYLKIFGLLSADCLYLAQKEADIMNLSASGRTFFSDAVGSFPFRPSVQQMFCPRQTQKNTL